MIFRLLFTLILLSHWNLATALELEVEIEGLDDALEKNVRHFLIIEREKGRAELTTGRVHHLHKQAPEQIRKALQPYGFFRSTTEAELLSNDKGFVAHYRVVTGEAVRLKQVAFLVEGPGRDDPVLTAGFPLVAGDASIKRPMKRPRTRYFQRRWKRAILMPALRFMSCGWIWIAIAPQSIYAGEWSTLPLRCYPFSSG